MKRTNVSLLSLFLMAMFLSFFNFGNSISAQASLSNLPPLKAKETSIKLLQAELNRLSNEAISGGFDPKNNPSDAQYLEFVNSIFEFIQKPYTYMSTEHSIIEATVSVLIPLPRPYNFEFVLSPSVSRNKWYPEISQIVNLLKI